MEKRFAKVVAGVVRNISVAARPEDATDCIPLIDGVDDEIGIGDLYDGSVFSKAPPPPPTTEELTKQAEREAVKQLQSAAKADATMQNFFTKTDAEITTYVRTQIDAQGVTDLASAKAALVKMETLLGKLGVIVAALGRTTLKGD